MAPGRSRPITSTSATVESVPGRVLAGTSDALWHHPHDRVRHTVVQRQDPPSEYPGVAAEPTLPGAMAEHQDRCRAVHIIRCAQRSTERGSRTEHVEKFT